MTALQKFVLKIQGNQLDSDGRLVQILQTVQRSCNCSYSRGKQPSGSSDFLSPNGVIGYYGFGADGQYYSNGVLGRVWHERESIDDFADKVTDTSRWLNVGGNPDLSEGGIDFNTTPNFGERLNCRYIGPGAEVYDRQGKMVYSSGVPGDTAILSSRVRTIAAQFGGEVASSILLAIQHFGSVNDFVFVGFANTVTYPFSVIQGECVGGIYTVTGSVVLPPGTEDVEIAIKVDMAGSTYQGYYALNYDARDYTSPGWSTVAAAQALPMGWPPDMVPRIHAGFGAGHAVGESWHMSDVRVEVNGGDWEGEQTASWYLEVSDITNPTDLTGLKADCPSEVLGLWERDHEGVTHLTLLNADDPNDVLLWRRWKNIGIWLDWDREEGPSFWTPGWLDGDEGHFVMTRNTRRDLGYSSVGEVWVISLRWDRIFVFIATGLGEVLSYWSPGYVMRETGSWGSRRWISDAKISAICNYDWLHRPKVTPFVGTYRNIALEVPAQSITYGVSVRRADDGSIYIGYGIQQDDTVPGNPMPVFAGLIRLEEGPGLAYPRWLFQKNKADATLWEGTDEGWPIVALSYARAIWWMQAADNGPLDELQGLVCRRSWVGLLPDNITLAPYNETNYWSGADRFMGRGININLMDSDPAGSEVVGIANGWLGGSHGSMLWYDPVNPAISAIKTFGGKTLGNITNKMQQLHPGYGFPIWFQGITEILDLNLAKTRIAMGAAVGSDGFVATGDGRLTAHWKFAGLATDHRRYYVFGGVPMERGDFVLELNAKLVPLWAPGYLYNVTNSMAPSQACAFAFGVMGERYMRAWLQVALAGQDVAAVVGQGSYRYANGGGILATNYRLLTPMEKAPGVDIRFRLVRKGSVWSLRFFSVVSGLWEEIISFDGPKVPLIPFMASYLQDEPDGVYATASLEIDSIVLAPSDDAVGSVHQRPVDFATIFSEFGSVASLGVLREVMGGPNSDWFVQTDGWVLPGFMARP